MLPPAAKRFSAGFPLCFHRFFGRNARKLAKDLPLAYGRREMAQTIVIYKDEGVGEFGLACLEKFLQGHDVWLATAEAIIDGRVLEMADLFIMPGGADLPYCKKLNGKGNENIKAYVEDGGTYLGICAGAYYGCRGIEFHKGRSDEISGPRELAFVDGVAYGSLPELAPHYDLTLKTAAAANITLPDGSNIPAFYHGGPTFRLRGHDTIVHATYTDIPGMPPAIIEEEFGDGRVILSGVHLEVSADDIAKHSIEEDGDDERRDNLASKLTAGSHDFLRTLIGL